MRAAECFYNDKTIEIEIDKGIFKLRRPILNLLQH